MPRSTESERKLLIRIGTREDYVPERMVRQLYESAVRRGEDDRAEYLLDRLTDPTTPTRPR